MYFGYIPFNQMQLQTAANTMKATAATATTATAKSFPKADLHHANNNNNNHIDKNLNVKVPVHFEQTNHSLTHFTRSLAL